MSTREHGAGLERHELLPGARVDEIRSLLLSAFADEWLAAYYYMLTAERIQGPTAAPIAEEFRKEAAEEITRHAPALAARLAELGGAPPSRFEDLAKLSGCGYPELPDDPYDVDGFIIAAIKAEICAINTYRRLYELSHGVDPVTEQLAKELLADEVRHRSEMIRLLTAEGLERLRRELGEQ